jgi:hypothetical protein
MSIDDAAEVSPSVTTDDLADRTQRALTEYLTVLDDVDAAAGADDLYAVVSESGSQYLVDTRTDSCECPDAEHRDPEGGCKHVRRVAFATGERPIPAAADGLDVDPQLGAHVDGPRWECDHGRTHCAESAGARDDAVRCSDCTAEVVADGGIIDAVDGAEVLDDESDDDDGRPDDCDCGDWNAGLGLPCWPCYREGFETPASADAAEDADR